MSVVRLDLQNGHRDALTLVRAYLDPDDERQSETLRLLLDV